MRASLSLVLFLLVSLPAYCQDIPSIPEGYKVDTLLRESATNPGVFDTIITYKKVNVVRQEVFIKDTSMAPSLFRWHIAVAGAYAFARKTVIDLQNNSLIRIEDSRVLSFDLFGKAKINHWSINPGIGLSFLKQELNHIYEVQEIQDGELLVRDTVDIFYVEDETGNRVPHYVIKEHVENKSDTVSRQINNYYPNHIAFLKVGLNGQYEFKLGNWVILPGVGYTIAIPISMKGRMINTKNESQDLSNENLNALNHIMNISMGVGYEVSPVTEFFLNGTFNIHLNGIYKAQAKDKQSFTGLQAGICFRLTQ